MLEKPNLPDKLIISQLQEAYGLRVSQLTFLPLGADVNTAVYRAVAVDGTPFFLKLRKGDFAEITVTLPQFLHAQGLRSIIAPLPARDGALWAGLEPYKMILYPFIEGQNGYEAGLADAQWLAFGEAMRFIHATRLPQALAGPIPRETCSPQWREMVKRFQAQAEEDHLPDPVAARLAAFMRSRRQEIRRIVTRAEALALDLQARQPEFVLCHADIHPGNLLIRANGALYIVDWDNPIFAPRERDLALIGGSSTWNSARETDLFYRAYQGSHPLAVDQAALSYYRYERIVQDIAAFCDQLFSSAEGGEDREQSYQYFTGSFLPNHDVEIAFRTDPDGG